tara:strand:+ start:809 stop:1051 length:243 start_codon:yes stop_codon:yes gene_type:complete
LTISRKEIKKITIEIESTGVDVLDWYINKHVIFTVENPITGTIKLISVAGSPKSKGVYHEIRSSVRKVFRKEGEILIKRG